MPNGFSFKVVAMDGGNPVLYGTATVLVGGLSLISRTSTKNALLKLSGG
jgi:hypothetical protein